MTWLLWLGVCLVVRFVDSYIAGNGLLRACGLVRCDLDVVRG